MATYKTPGVYIEEIQLLAPSVAPVPTAVPGFIGYTEKAVIDGELWDHTADGIAPPVRITSMLEYQQIFGGPNNEDFTVTLTDGLSGTDIAVSPATSASLSKFILFYQMQMFYANGGGTCWIVSVDDYSATSIDPDDLGDGVDSFEKIDEVTLLVTPESVFLTGAGDRAGLNDKMLAQCAKLQDRFTVMDTVHNSGNTIQEDADDFRNADVGIDNLKYGATYYPALNTVLSYAYLDTEVDIVDSRSAAVYTAPLDKLNYIHNGGVLPNAQAVGSITLGTFANLDDGDEITIYGVTLTATSATPAAFEFELDTDSPTTAANLAAAINLVTNNLSTLVTASATGAAVSLQATPANAGTQGNIAIGLNATNPLTYTIVGMHLGTDFVAKADKALYNSITAKLATYKLSLYPSATMVGIYARVDNERGVWKAPANTGVTFTIAPSILITNEEQENLNVDSVSGKSINAIRKFAGKGNIVWGARTLAGNDNEWRYINVRRLFIFVEESVKKATESVVFEGNTANTWNRVRSTIESFLTEIWREGALAGATTKDAYFVRVGLGITMTAQDILEGRLIVDIGMAAVRPAEFIVLRFMHKLQES